MQEFYKYSSDIDDSIQKLAKDAEKSTIIDNSYYEQYDVKRGLRDINGRGVLAGLTEISDIQAFRDVDGVRVPIDGQLKYRGININDIVDGFATENRFGFEEVCYLLLFGKLPNKAESLEFNNILTAFSSLPRSFVRDILMKAPSVDMMNALSRSVLTLYYYDDNADDTSISNVLRQCLQLIARFPLMSVYGYKVFRYYHGENSLVIHNPDPSLSIAENTLRLLRDDCNFTALEAKMLDLMLVLHAEHGGGNNSSFTTHVVSSSGTDTYSTVAASLGSLKGPKHGGANIKVVKMFEDMKNHVKHNSDDEICDYLVKLLNKQGFDKSGLIYGMGHAVYSLSDPRATILRNYVKELAFEKDRQEEYELYKKVEKLAPQVIGEKRQTYKGVSANIDFYSGFVYSMLDIPTELFTPMFGVSRIVGWSAHRIEEISNNGKIIRPGYECVAANQKYVPLKNRT